MWKLRTPHNQIFFLKLKNLDLMIFFRSIYWKKQNYSHDRIIKSSLAIKIYMDLYGTL